MFAGHIQLVRSLDGGATWTSISAGAGGTAVHGDHHALAFAADGSTLYEVSDGGIFSTTDVITSPITWKSLNAGLGITQFYGGLSIHPTNVAIGFGGSQDTGTLAYAGSTPWRLVTCGDGGWTAIDPVDPTNVYAGCQQISVLKSTQAGAPGTFRQSQNGINSTDRVEFIPPLVMDPSNSKRLYFGTFRLYQTFDGAASWNAISPDLAGGSNTLTAIGVSERDPNTIYLGTNAGHVQVTGDALSLSGAASHWRDRSSGLPSRTVTQIVVDPENASTAYVTLSGFALPWDTRGNVFMTSHGGVSWRDISGICQTSR